MTTEQQPGAVAEGDVENEINAVRMKAKAATEIASIAGDLSGLVDDGGDNKRGEVSANTIARMMGLVTMTDLKLLESKLDLTSTRVNTMMTKLERVMGGLTGLATGSDMDRIDAQLAALRSLIKDAMPDIESGKGDDKKIGSKIVTSKPSEE